MASVYKTVSKKAARQLAKEHELEEEDVEMEELLADADDTTDSEDDEETTTESAKKQLAAGFMPKTRVLMLTSRGVTSRHRHLLADLASLLPHSHKETKLDTKKKTTGYNLLLNSLADLHSCNVIFFLEARKQGQDLYLWLARPPNGPTIKFHVANLHTMAELNAGFSGNCLKGGRGIVVFDQSFDEQGPLMSQPGNEYRGLIREMLRGVFCVPKRGVKGMKPFIDRIIGIFGVDGKIWIRVYEIRESEPGKKKEDGEETKPVPKGKDGLPEVSLVEIGPRFVLTPIVILEGSFGGPVIYENKEYVSPNQVRRDVRLGKAARYASRRDMETDRFSKRTTLGLAQGERKPDALDTRQLFNNCTLPAVIMVPPSQSSPGWLMGVHASSSTMNLTPFCIYPYITMPFTQLATELLLHIFRSCETISDLMNLTQTCRRLHTVFYRSNKLQILIDVAEFEFGPRAFPHIITERAQLLHNWSTTELAEIEDVRSVIGDIVQNHICPSNGTIQRKFRKRYPESTHQLAFNIHLNYQSSSSPTSTPGLLEKSPGLVDQYFHTAHPSNLTESPASYKSRFRNDYFHDPGFEGWGDEIPHYYVVQDMMKLDPGQVLWLRERAPLKEQVEVYIRSFGDWFRDNGETFSDTLEWVMKERGDDIEGFRSAIADRETGVVWD
ncbi:Brix-domain-containing protein [Aspergillus heteromorphus CBS 117.55]|uniref:Brix-domain-containing protein n=1 Tax=Aspergillus heteromorphus CBS 117.55 TaxID=1448321 RepID=A0A317WNP9_9EURO|nr:Brix-domain-containing protein [Aspergillus heteromorphus CBS 117.55]PWY86902.1 Brix-domain-containing protein [Aspergillus heteromorphus CBS 117.55]